MGSTDPRRFNNYSAQQASSAGDPWVLLARFPSADRQLQGLVSSPGLHTPDVLRSPVSPCLSRSLRVSQGLSPPVSRLSARVSLRSPILGGVASLGGPMGAAGSG
ncbi:unnamed protein product [Lampetra planeri]